MTDALKCHCAARLNLLEKDIYRYVTHPIGKINAASILATRLGKRLGSDYGVVAPTNLLDRLGIQGKRIPHEVPPAALPEAPA